MDSEISGTVLSAAPRVVGNNKTIYDVAFSDGNTYTTFDAKLWAKVQTVGQQLASARVAVKQNGNYTNFYLNDIAPQGQLPPPGVTLHAPAPGPAAVQAVQQPQVAQQIARAQNGGMSPEREQKIVKQSSFSTAFNFVGLLYQGGAGDSETDEAMKLAYTLAKDLYKHVMGEQQAEPAEAPVTASVAENGQGDGIPW